jgi:hypothetical protein
MSTGHQGFPDASFLGSMLFMRCVSGTRVVTRGGAKSVGPLKFQGYGASVDDYPTDYLTAACALGVTRSELDDFLSKLDKTLGQYKKGRKGKGGSERPASQPLPLPPPPPPSGTEEGVPSLAQEEGGCTDGGTTEGREGSG